MKYLRLDKECPMCGGAGGWSHPLKPEGFEKCKVCNGTGSKLHIKLNH